MKLRANHVSAGEKKDVAAETCRSASPRSLEIGTMQTHKFRIGQIVTYRRAMRGQDASPGAYMIIARLPESADGQFEYRIRNLSEEHERVAHLARARGLM